MQIKVRGNKVQLLRSEYTTARRDDNGNLIRGTGRCTQKLLGSFDRLTEKPDEVPEEIKGKLMEEEALQLQDWIEEAVKERKQIEREKALRTLSENMQSAILAVEDGVLLEDDEAQEIYKSWSAFQTALRKAGHKRGKK